MGKRLPAIVILLVVGAASIALGRFALDGLAVATGYAAKLTCSLSLTSGQPAEVVAAELLDHVLAPVSRRIAVTAADCCASARVFGLLHARAIHRRGLGCTLLAGRDEKEMASLGELPPRPSLDAGVPWPLGDAEPSTAEPAIAAAMDVAFRELDAPGSGRLRQTKAVVVAHRGRLVAERYAAGYSASTPMISWSMAKSVTAALVGIAVSEGKLALAAPAPVREWAAAGDPRGAIVLDQLLRMSSGLAFDETYGAVNDVSRMLFTEPDTAAYAARSPLAGEPDSLWSYSSGTSNIVARLLREAIGGDVTDFVRYSRERLFDAAGMTSAFFEHDAAGTPVGSSFVFMTARDWARFGELHRRDGLVDSRRVLPEGWVRYVTTPTPRAPEGSYGAHWWLNAGEPSDTSRRPWPALPVDAYAARGYSGQWVLVVPSKELVIVRLGIAIPDDGDDGTEELAAAVIEALARR
ncbi:MAG: serine hydrolase domain-containing protein [Candidatus Binatia bacterium]